MNTEIKTAIGNLLAPSSWYQRAISHIMAHEGEVQASYEKTESAIDNMDVTVSVSGDEDGVHIDAEVSGRSLANAHSALTDMRQSWYGEQDRIRTETIDSLLEDMLKTLGKLDPQLREIAEEQGVRDEWMELVNDLGATTNFVQFAAKNLEADTILWLLDGIEGVNHRPHMLMTGICHISTILGQPGWEGAEAQLEAWLTAARRMGPDKKTLHSFYLASELKDPDRRLASVMDKMEFDFKSDAESINWAIVIEHTTNPGTKTTANMVAEFLEKHIEEIAARFPVLTGSENTDQKPAASQPLSRLAPVQFPERMVTLGEMVSIAEKNTKNKQLSARLEAIRINARTPKARGEGRGMRL